MQIGGEVDDVFARERFHMTTHDGVVTTVRAVAALVGSQRVREVVGVLGTYANITVRRRAEEAIREDSATLRPEEAAVMMLLQQHLARASITQKLTQSRRMLRSA